MLLKRGYPIIFASNIFPNSHLIQKRIQNQQLLLILCTLLNQMRDVKNIRRKDDRVISLQVVLVSSISNFFTNKTSLANKWMSFISNNLAFLPNYCYSLRIIATSYICHPEWLRHPPIPKGSENWPADQAIFASFYKYSKHSGC